jgi:hypothetical protein
VSKTEKDRLDAAQRAAVEALSTKRVCPDKLRQICADVAKKVRK